MCFRVEVRCKYGVGIGQHTLIVCGFVHFYSFAYLTMRGDTAMRKTNNNTHQGALLLFCAVYKGIRLMLENLLFPWNFRSSAVKTISSLLFNANVSIYFQMFAIFWPWYGDLKINRNVGVKQWAWNSFLCISWPGCQPNLTWCSINEINWFLVLKMCRWTLIVILFHFDKLCK